MQCNRTPSMTPGCSSMYVNSLVCNTNVGIVHWTASDRRSKTIVPIDSVLGINNQLIYLLQTRALSSCP
jgi:hypothetical protein